MEKKAKLDKILAVTVLVVLFALFLQIIAGQGIYKIFGVDLGKTKSVSNIIDINWAGLYPFSADDVVDGDDSTTATDVISTQVDADRAQGTLSKMYGLYSKAMTKLETLGESWDSHILGYSDIAKWGYVFNACFSDPGIGGEYIRLNNGYWTTVSETEEDGDSIQEKADALEDLNGYLQVQGIPFLYVQAAVKNCQYDTELPVGVEDYTNENISKLLETLDNVDYIDMREALHEDYDDHYGLFYKTDHHWNVDAGFWACNVIEQEIQDRYGITFNTDYNDSSKYSRTTYENAMFGSAGQAITHFVEKSEDFSILFPDFETNFQLVIPDKGIDTTGDFAGIFVNYDGLNEAISNGGGYAYEKILYGNRPLVQITNYGNEDGPRVLMIRDSFSIAVSLYMSLGCSELDLIDTRLGNGNFTGSVRTYIEQMKPDIVVMLVSNPSTSYK